MASRSYTWQARGEYLARCFGISSERFASGLDLAMGRAEGIAQRPAATRTAGTSTTHRTRTRTRTPRTKVPAGADQ